jgi:hypothetical protein
MEGDVAGDFHEVVDLRDGRFAVIIGDAPGFGAAAAEHADRIRNHARAELARGAAPAEVLWRVDRALAAEDPERVATAMCAIVDPAERHVVVANAGHPPALLVGNDDAHWLQVPPDPPLGIACERGESSCALVPECTLFFYTDGLIERRGVALSDSLDVLHASALTVTGSAAWASALARIATVELGTPTDDATILSVRIAAPSPPGVRPAFAGLDRQHAAIRLFLDPSDHRSAHMEAVVRDLVDRLRPAIELDVHVVDPALEPGLWEGVIATPTVVRTNPAPPLRLIGTVQSAEELARALHIPFAEGN